MINLNLPSNSIGRTDIVVSGGSVEELQNQKVVEVEKKSQDAKSQRMVVQLQNAKHVALNRDIPVDDFYTSQL